MKQLIWDCQKDIAAYHPPESGISEHELVKMLMARLDGRQAKEAWETIGRAGARTMTAGTMTAAAPLLKIERWPDINRAAVGIGQAPLQLRSRRCHHLAWAYSPCSKGTASNVACLYVTRSGDGIKEKRGLYWTLVWIIDDKRLRRPAVRNFSTISGVVMPSG